MLLKRNGVFPSWLSRKQPCNAISEILCLEKVALYTCASVVVPVGKRDNSLLLGTDAGAVIC